MIERDYFCIRLYIVFREILHSTRVWIKCCFPMTITLKTSKLTTTIQPNYTGWFSIFSICSDECSLNMTYLTPYLNGYCCRCKWPLQEHKFHCGNNLSDICVPFKKQQQSKPGQCKRVRDICMPLRHLHGERGVYTVVEVQISGAVIGPVCNPQVAVSDPTVQLLLYSILLQDMGPA